MKRLTFGLIAMAGLLCTSCDMGTKDTTQTWPSIIVCNLVTPLDGEACAASASIYNVDFNWTKQTVTLDAGFSYKSANYTFSAENMPLTTTEDGSLYMKGFSANVNNQPTLQLSNANLMFLTNFVYPYSEFPDPDDPNNKDKTFKLNAFYPNAQGYIPNAWGAYEKYGDPVAGVLYTPTATATGAGMMVVGGYQVGQDFQVNTFTTDCTYEGITTTSYPGMGGMQSYTSKTIYYRIVLDITEKKACVVMYNAKFSNVAAEPAKPIVYLKGLDITWGNGKYEVSGENLVPQIILDNKLESYPAFTFKSFKMETVGSAMVDAHITYEVDNTVGERTINYRGTFTGKTATIPSTFN